MKVKLLMNCKKVILKCSWQPNYTAFPLIFIWKRKYTVVSTFVFVDYVGRTEAEWRSLWHTDCHRVCHYELDQHVDLACRMDIYRIRKRSAPRQDPESIGSNKRTSFSYLLCVLFFGYIFLISDLFICLFVLICKSLLYIWQTSLRKRQMYKCYTCKYFFFIKS